MIVVDASVAVQWIVDEPGSELSASLIERGDMVAPTLLLVELANALRRKVRDGQAIEEQARAGISRVAGRVKVIQPDVGLIERAFDLSIQLVHPLYDCVYLALAEALTARFVTNDEAFRQVAAAGGFDRLISGLPVDDTP